jgi:hypothetical protein
LVVGHAQPLLILENLSSAPMHTRHDAARGSSGAIVVGSAWPGHCHTALQ